MGEGGGDLAGENKLESVERLRQAERKRGTTNAMRTRSRHARGDRLVICRLRLREAAAIHAVVDGVIPAARGQHRGLKTQ